MRSFPSVIVPFLNLEILSLIKSFPASMINRIKSKIEEWENDQIKIEKMGEREYHLVLFKANYCCCVCVCVSRTQSIEEFEV